MRKSSINEMHGYQLPDRPPKEFKQIKKEMQHALYYFKRMIEQSNFPTQADMERYKKVQAAFALSSPRQWGKGIADAESAVDRLEKACVSEDKEATLIAIEALFEIKNKYHSLFK